jgi:hypothetical protein
MAQKILVRKFFAVAEQVEMLIQLKIGLDIGFNSASVSIAISGIVRATVHRVWIITNA